MKRAGESTLAAPSEPLNVGEAFNPYGRFNGIFVPLSLLPCRDLSDGAKLLYGRLCFFAGEDGECYPGRETLAREMGVDVATIGRQLKELVDFGLIRRQRRGPGHPATCVFLWHDVLADSAKVRHHKSTQLAHSNSSDGADMRDLDDAKMRLANKEEKTQREEIQEKERRQSGGYRGRELLSTTTTATRQSDEKPTRRDSSWWSNPEAAVALRNLLMGPSHTPEGRLIPPRLPEPCASVISAIAQHMRGLEDARRWLQSSRTLLAKATGWGLYITDAKQWPSRRALAEALARSRAEIHTPTLTAEAPPAAAKRGLEVLNCEPAEDCERSERAANNGERDKFEPESGLTPAPPCPKCEDSGIVGSGSENDLYAWCNCTHGRTRLNIEPHAVEKAN